MTFKNKLNNIQPIIAGSTAIVTIPTGANAPTLDKVQLTLSGAALVAAKINGIRGFVNGVEVYKDGTGTVHNARRTYLGQTATTTELVINLTEPNARSAVEQNLSAWPLALMQSCWFELDLDATAGADAMIKGLAHFRAPTNNPFIKKQRTFPIAFANAGEQIIFIPNGPAGGKLVRVWIHESAAGNITAVKLSAKNAVGIEASRVALQNDQIDNGLVPQAGVLVLDFIADGNLAGWFDTSQLADVQLALTGTAAATYTLYLEYLDPIGRL